MATAPAAPATPGTSKAPALTRSTSRIGPTGGPSRPMRPTILVCGARPTPAWPGWTAGTPAPPAVASLAGPAPPAVSPTASTAKAPAPTAGASMALPRPPAAAPIGVYGVTGSDSGYAGYFVGRVHVTGTLSKSAGSFKIDHPLDPANQYLSHSFVESPDMMNVYNGNATLDETGRGLGRAAGLVRGAQPGLPLPVDAHRRAGAGSLHCPGSAE